MHILIADDDRRMGHLLRSGLESEGHVVDVVEDGEAALALVEAGAFDAVVLDVMMPRLGGIEVLARLRAGGDPVPVLLLTARGAIEDRVGGLNAGADDYLVKPFDFDELLARLHAIVRRHNDPASAVLASGDVTLDSVRHEVTVDGRSVDLAPTEFRLLEVLLRHPGQVLSRRQLLARVWGYEEEPQDNVVDVYVHYLRRKLGDGWGLKTVRGIGYRLDPLGRRDPQQ